jgi:1,4-dihydroxy-2-naphthoate octaprenyltransferase
VKAVLYLKRYGQYIWNTPVRLGESDAICFYLAFVLTALVLVKFPVIALEDHLGQVIWFFVYPLCLLQVIRDHVNFFTDVTGD